MTIYKKALLIGMSVAILAAPLVSSADTLASLQAQIQGLLAQIQALQVQSTTSVSTGTGSSVSGTALSSCPSFLRSLQFGSSGSDVISLQQFLSQQGDFNATATGYFGPLTRAAVVQWQSQNGIAVSGSVGSGIFGPISRAFLVRSCGGQQQSFSADPQSGLAPLTTTFSTSDSIATSATYSVDFGDGQNGNMTKGSCIAITAIVGGQGGIRCSYNVTHTYPTNGTYVAHLMKNTCPAGAQCLVGPQVAGTVVIAVGSTTNPNIQDLNAPTSVTLSAGGIAEVRNEHFYFTLDSLTASSATIEVTPVGCWNSFPTDPPPQIRCMIAIFPIAPQTLSVGQTYGTPNYTITLTGINGSTATFSVNANSMTNAGAPVITGLDAPTSLSVGAVGTWTVHATAPANSQLSYSVNWGDQTTVYPLGASMAATVSTSGTFTHTYSTPGTYTPTFTVSNSSGSAQTSATTVVQSAVY